MLNNTTNLFIPRMAIKLDRLGRYEEDYRNVMTICKKSLARHYTIVCDEDCTLIYIGRSLDDTTNLRPTLRPT
jgi:hypothetical protein